MDATETEKQRIPVYRRDGNLSLDPSEDAEELCLELDAGVSVRYSAGYGQSLVYLPPGVYGQPVAVAIKTGWARLIDPEDEA